MEARDLPRRPAASRFKRRFSAMAVPLLCGLATAQTRVPLQPFVQEVRQVEATLAYLGEPLPPKDEKAIQALFTKTDEAEAVSGLEQILDQHTLAIVEINPESRVKVRPGPAKHELVEAGTRVFLVKVSNLAGVTARLQAKSPNALPVSIQSDGSAEPPKEISSADLRDRWMGLDLYDKDPMSERLSGLPLEYRVLEIYSRDPFRRRTRHAGHRLSQPDGPIV